MCKNSTQSQLPSEKLWTWNFTKIIQSSDEFQMPNVEFLIEQEKFFAKSEIYE